MKHRKDGTAESVYCNGRIYTVDPAFSVASALAVRDGRFIFAGSDEGARAFAGEQTVTIDLQGQTVLPGLIDSHLHFQAIGLSLMRLDAFLKPKQGILDDVAEAYNRSERGGWIQGWGWSQLEWDPPVLPTKEELDAIAPDVPVVLARVCGHVTWVNSRALELAGITADTPDPPGGEIIRDHDGSPTGVLVDTAIDYVTRHVPEPTESEKTVALKLAQEHLLSYGITGVRDAAYRYDPAMVNEVKSLYSSGELKMRIYQMCSPETAAELFYGLPAGEREGLYDNRYTIRSVKLMADGSLGGGSAWLLEEYSDRPGHFGNPRYTDEDLYGLVKEARRAGFQVNTHALGDAAVRQALNAYERVLTEEPATDHRYCIEHAEVVALEDIPRFARLGVLPSMQTVFATSDWKMAETRLGHGSQRLKRVNAFRKFLESGCIVANGTDSPVELVNPYHNLYAAVTRVDRDGQPPGGWYPEECLTREEALRSYTIWAAYAQFEEHTRGSIEAGKLADFVVIDRDYMLCPAEEIKDLEALRTVLGGENLYVRSQRS